MLPFNITIGLLIFALGAVMGSFYNVCIYRLPLGKSIIAPPSECPVCHHRLQFFDMLPIINIIYLKRSCRYCHASISLRYPLVETITAFVFLGAYLRFGLSLELPFYLCFLSLLILISMIDIDHRMIMDRFFIMGLVLAIVFLVVPFFVTEGMGQFTGGVYADRIWSAPQSAFDRIKAALLGGASGGLILLFIDVAGKIIFHKDSMGLGDVKLMIWIGLFLGLSQTILALLFAIWIGAIVGAILLYSRRSKQENIDHYMPFGPFCAIGSVIALFFGTDILSWYLSLMH
jgi:leader peptidase (prepilin peptidase) / N-methyltransferase